MHIYCFCYIFLSCIAGICCGERCKNQKTTQRKLAIAPEIIQNENDCVEAELLAFTDEPGQTPPLESRYPMFLQSMLFVLLIASLKALKMALCPSITGLAVN